MFCSAANPSLPWKDGARLSEERISSELQPNGRCRKWSEPACLYQHLVKLRLSTLTRHPLPSLQGPKHPSKIHWLPLKDLSRQELKESKRFMSSQVHRWKAMFGKQCFEVSPWSPQDPECQNLQTLLPHVQPGNMTVKPGNRVDFLLLWLHEQITGCLCNKAANQSKFSELEAKHNSLRISNLWYLFYSTPPKLSTNFLFYLGQVTPAGFNLSSCKMCDCTYLSHQGFAKCNYCLWSVASRIDESGRSAIYYFPRVATPRATCPTCVITRPGHPPAGPAALVLPGPPRNRPSESLQTFQRLSIKVNAWMKDTSGEDSFVNILSARKRGRIPNNPSFFLRAERQRTRITNKHREITTFLQKFCKHKECLNTFAGVICSKISKDKIPL